MFLQKNTSIQIWDLGIWLLAMVGSFGCEAWIRLPRPSLVLSSSNFAWEVGPSHSLKLGGPCGLTSPAPLCCHRPSRQCVTTAAGCSLNSSQSQVLEISSTMAVGLGSCRRLSDSKGFVRTQQL